ncbi:hypothetical protein [Nonomuraea wenchangensis]|uniref:hypothetical protein n=1 Tax=Nonomuraea wenchangensis TaxID=568860 RepID=UPI0033E46410
MYFVAETAHLLEDAGTAARAYALLSPYAGLPVIGSLGVVCFGSVEHPLGMAALTTGDVDLAVRHLRAAVQANLALGHWPAAALSRCRLGQALALRDGPRDGTARAEPAAAAREARDLGMALPGVVGSAAGRAGEARRTCRFLRDGRHWRIELGGRVAVADHSVGMGHLAALVAHPGREILAADLAAGTWSREGGGSSAQPVLDDLARDSYRERLTRLQAEIDELEEMNDLERASALRLECEWPAAATGIGGRARPFAGRRGAGQDRGGQGDPAGAVADRRGGSGDRGGTARVRADRTSLLLPPPVTACRLPSAKGREQAVVEYEAVRKGSEPP